MTPRGRMSRFIAIAARKALFTLQQMEKKGQFPVAYRNRQTAFLVASQYRYPAEAFRPPDIYKYMERLYFGPQT